MISYSWMIQIFDAGSSAWSPTNHPHASQPLMKDLVVIITNVTIALGPADGSRPRLPLETASPSTSRSSARPLQCYWARNYSSRILGCCLYLIRLDYRRQQRDDSDLPPASELVAIFHSTCSPPFISRTRSTETYFPLVRVFSPPFFSGQSGCTKGIETDPALVC